MKILALIPARSGSKRVPNKNVRLLGGKPLIVWTIETALNTLGLCDVLVSTDSAETQTISSAAGASVPWLRPSQIANDEASSVDVAIHALDIYENEHGEVCGLLLLQPTSPFRTTDYIERGIAKYISGSGDSVVGVSPVRENPDWMVTIPQDQIKKYENQYGVDTRRENLYVINGSFYLTSPVTLRERKSFYSARTRPLICKSVVESFDIDTEADFELAQRICYKEDYENRPER